MGTMYGVQTFTKRGSKLLPGQPITDKDEALMLRRGERLAKDHAGVVVYKVEVDDDIGDVDEPIIIARHGDLPPAYADAMV